MVVVKTSDFRPTSFVLFTGIVIEIRNSGFDFKIVVVVGREYVKQLCIRA